MYMHTSTRVDEGRKLEMLNSPRDRKEGTHRTNSREGGGAPVVILDLAHDRE